MVKQRFGTADVAAEVACLRQRNMIGMRVTNIYDISSRNYVIKFARSGEDGDKVLLLIESGIRFHTIDTMPEKSDVPSNFTLKLRKHIRSRRLESIKQLGNDRVVQLTFGSGEGTYHLLLEFYAQGNIILTDINYEVLTLLRSHRDDNKGIAFMARHIYPVRSIRLREPFPQATLDEALSNAAIALDTLKDSAPLTTTTTTTTTSSSSSNTKQNKPSSKKDLRTVLFDVFPYGATVAEHCILQAGLDRDRSLQEHPLTLDEQLSLMTAIRSFEKWLDGCEDNAPAGCITVLNGSHPIIKTDADADVSKKTLGECINEESKPHEEKKECQLYNEFQPMLSTDRPFSQYASQRILSFPTFDAAVSHFFSKLQGQRTTAQQAQLEKQVLGKVDAIKRDNAARVETLGKEGEEAEFKALLIELNMELVEAAMNAVREALAGGMDWSDLGRMIKEEKKAGNPLALMVDSLQLEKNKITLLLQDPFVEDEEDDDDEEEEEDDDDNSNDRDEAEHAHDDDKDSRNHRTNTTKQRMQQQQQQQQQQLTKVQVDLDHTAHANARIFHETRKRHTDKARRTLEANDHALAAAEKKALEQLAKVQKLGANSGSTGHPRKPYWFEKFHFFISSENYLVVSGRDAQQNEVLVKRYMNKGDTYVHADLHGASSMIVKNHTPSIPVPPMTLTEAGQACVCRSAAWDAKVVASAWWVYPEQVSKTAPSGEYLTTGSFMIRGKKNYLPPQPLVMGIAFLFGLEEGSVAAHLNERAPRVDMTALTGVAGDSKEEGEEEEEEEEADRQDDDGEDDDHDVVGGGGDKADDGQRRGEGGRSSGTYDSHASRAATAKASLLDNFMDMSIESLQKSRAATRGGAAEDAFNRYGLESSMPIHTGGESYRDGEEANRKEEQKGDGRSHRHLSTKERQLLKKKGGSLPGAGAPSVEGKSSPAPQQMQRVVEQPQQTKKTRGAKGKKVQRKKYEEQDDEERELAMALLKSAGQKKDKKARKEERRARVAARKAAHSGLQCQAVSAEDIARMTARLDVDTSTTSSSENGNDNNDGDEPAVDDVHADEDHHQQATESDDGGGEDGSEPEREKKDREEAAALLAEEGVGLLDDSKKEKLTQLDELTGCPRPEDVLLHAMPVVAPYQVVSGYKYKVKIVPGNLKKGKSFKQAIALMMASNKNVDAAQQRERDLIKSVPELEGINQALGGVKLQVAGMQKMKQAKKGAKKKN